MTAIEWHEKVVVVPRVTSYEIVMLGLFGGVESQSIGGLSEPPSYTMGAELLCGLRKGPLGLLDRRATAAKGYWA